MLLGSAPRRVHIGRTGPSVSRPLRSSALAPPLSTSLDEHVVAPEPFLSDGDGIDGIDGIGGPGGGGAGGRGGDDGDFNLDGDDEQLPAVQQLLTESGFSVDDIPRDLQLAIASGRLSLTELGNYVQVLGNPVLRAIAGASEFIRNRLIASPKLCTVIAVETVVGLATMMAAEVNSRGDRFWKEIDFVVCDLALIIATNMALVVSLSPSAAVAAPAQAGVGRVLASFPSTCLQPGAFTPLQRLGCFVSNALMFGSIGMASSVVGASATKGLVHARERLTGERPDVELAPVLRTSSAYGAFVSTSSSTRYQLVNALEASVFPLLRLPHGMLTLAVRTGNNFLGGVHWISWARWMGVQ